MAVSLTSIYQLYDGGAFRKQGHDFHVARFQYNRALMLQVQVFRDVMVPEKRDSICWQGELLTGSLYERPGGGVVAHV